MCIIVVSKPLLTASAEMGMRNTDSQYYIYTESYSVLFHRVPMWYRSVYVIIGCSYTFEIDPNITKVYMHFVYSPSQI